MWCPRSAGLRSTAESIRKKTSTEEKANLLGALEQCKQDGIPLEWEVLQEGQSASCRPDEALGVALTRRCASGQRRFAALRNVPWAPGDPLLCEPWDTRIRLWSWTAFGRPWAK